MVVVDERNQKSHCLGCLLLWVRGEMLWLQLGLKVPLAHNQTDGGNKETDAQLRQLRVSINVAMADRLWFLIVAKSSCFSARSSHYPSL